MKARLAVTLITLLVVSACKQQPEQLTVSHQYIVEEMVSPTADNASLARLFSHQGELWMSWVQQNDSMAFLYHASMASGQWSEPELVAQGDDWFNNWADFPVIAVNGDKRIGTYLQRSADGTYTYDVMLNHQGDQGWTKGIKVNRDTTKSEHGFVSVVPVDNDSFFLSWLDGRNTAGSHDHDHGGGGAMTLRGAIIGPDGELLEDTELDGRVCDCCNTTTAMTSSGLIVAYRDRSLDEIRDIAVVRQIDGEWSDPKFVHADNWEIAGCPVNGPALHAKGSDVVLAWFTAADGEGEVRLSFSSDSGAQFAPFHRIDNGMATGRVDVVLLDPGTAAVIWMEPAGEQEVIQLKIIKDSGEILHQQIITQTSPERASGFPQLALYQDQLIFAWTEKGELVSAVNLASMQLPPPEPKDE